MAKIKKHDFKKLLTGKNFLFAVLGIVFYPQIKKIALSVKKIIDSITGIFISEEEQARITALENWLEKLESTINYKNLNADNHELVATTLYEYFDGIGTAKKDVISDTFLNQNWTTVDDLKLIIVKYGIKTTHLLIFSDTTGTLVSHIESELSGSLREDILNHLKELQIL